MKKLDWFLLAGVVTLILVALMTAASPMDGGERFAGADSLAEKAIGELAPDYAPWWKPLWEPPSGEIASLLFALQAATGAGVIGYFLGKKVTLKRLGSKK